MQECLSIVIQTLSNGSKQFIKEQSANALFLISQMQSMVQDEFNQLASQTALDPVLWLAIHGFHALPNKNFISGYPSEFPSLVFGKDLMIATRVFVAEGLASWVYFHDLKKFDFIISIGLQRFNELNNFELQFNKFNKLKLKSQYLIYFVTHIILLAGFYGQRALIQNDFANIIIVFKKWIQEIESKQNLEIYLELLLCMQILNQPIDIKETMKLFNIEKTIKKNQHECYHTFALWALLMNQIKKE